MARTIEIELALIACLSALPLMAGLTGCARDPANQGTGRRIDHHQPAKPDHNKITDQGIADSRTAVRVREALAAGAEYKYDGVKVKAGNGVVQLSGYVNTSAQKVAAGAVASQVVDVNRVENNLTIKE